jgi:hypothetical protein
MRTVLWQDPASTGAERCTLDSGRSGTTFSGTALVVAGSAPCEVRYRVRVDQAGLTRRVDVESTGPDGDGRLTIEVGEGGQWLINDAHQPDLDGCLDVDLEFTPATNSLPIRRLALAVGDGADIRVAWVRYPSLKVEPAGQRYTRTAEASYEFRSTGFKAELTVDEALLVDTYAGYWRQVAATG